MNSIFTEENLLAFTTAARFGSFSKAADELGLTTSAISYTIKRMETGLDVVLFTRNTRSIELTESGRYFFRKATDLLNDFHAIGAPDTLLDGGGIDYTEIGAIRWAFAIAPDHPLAFMPEPIAESQLRLYPNIMVEDTAHTINKKVGWLLHGQESILVPDFNTKCQCQILGEGIGFLPDYMVREAMTQSLLVTRQIHNPRQDSRMLLATQHSATGQVTQWIKKQFAPNGILTGIYQDLLHREN
ncbi:TPA: LysR family transcriptional regulator [Escherichia coli]|nr:LysR family transcriptional regulator [Escherichia coli]